MIGWKEAFFNRIKGELEAINAELDRLDIRAAQRIGGTELRAQEQLQELRRTRNEIRQNMAKLRGADDKTWGEMKHRVERTVHGLKGAIERLKSGGFL